jgi:mRNA-degrading endonuclease toxin of MazEF toxin-antitoxin module
MTDKINFNKKIKYSDIETGSLVWVNFGETKHLFLQEMERQLKENCFNIQDCPHGLNLLHEFSYYHMAFLVSNKFNDTVAVVPLTEYKHDDEKYTNLNVILDIKDFGLTLMKKSTIKLDQLRFIDKTRIVKVEKKLISKTLKNLLEKKIYSLFSM